MRRFAAAAAMTVAVLVAAALLASTAPAVGPYPDLGGCPVFPQPPATTPANAPSLPTEAAWNQDVSGSPVAPNSAATIAYINANGGEPLYPDFGSPSSSALPYSSLRACP